MKEALTKALELVDLYKLYIKLADEYIEQLESKVRQYEAKVSIPTQH